MKIRFDNCNKPSIKDLLIVNRSNAFFKPELNENNFCFTGSGKAALSAVLQFLRAKKVLASKMSRVLVPQWLGVQVYQTLLNQCLITTTYSKDVKSIIAYHQYGFPQNMWKLKNFCLEEKLVLIEDCAHAIDSKYNDTPLGSFGDFSIYSFSKFCFCFVLGGIYFKDNEFASFFFKKKMASSEVIKHAINIFKLIDELALNYKINFSNLREMAYSLYPNSFKYSALAKKIFSIKIKHEIEARKTNYNFLKSNLKNYDFISHLDVNVTPYAVPLLIKKNRDKIVRKINEKNIECGEYWFDVNRFVVEPKFERCVLLPIHSNVSLDTLNFIVNVIKENI